MGERWKRYEKQGIWKYEQHPFWCTGYTYVRLLLTRIVLDLIHRF